MNPGLMPVGSLLGFPAPVAPPEPFMWGQGGERVSPEEVAARRAEAAQMMATGMDFSPVDHWTQGLARTVQGGLGGYLDSQAREDQTANEGIDAEIRAALLSGQADDQQIAAALLDPAASPQTREFAAMEMQRRNPPAQAPTDFQQLLLGAGIQPGTPEWIAANQRAVDARVDPFTVLQVGDNTLNGPQSLVSEALALITGGGGQASGAGPVEAPATLPPDFNFDEPGGSGGNATGGFRQ